MTASATFDFLDDTAYVDGRAEDWLTYLRHNEPVWRSPDPGGGPGVWMLSKHEDVAHVSRTPLVFSSDSHNGGIDGLTEAEREETVNALTGVGRMFIMIDPPLHGLVRRNLQYDFTPRAVRKHAEHIRHITRQVIDRALDKREIDFMEDVAVPIPLYLVADVIGVPDADRQWLFKHIINTERPADPAVYQDPEYVASVRKSIEEVRAYGREMIRERQQNPRDDLMSRVANSTVDGEPIPFEDKVSNFYLLWAAGVETTRTALAWGMLGLLENPDQWDLLKANPGLLDGPATEEILRWATPVHQFRRNVMEDTEIRGVPIRKGEAVVMWYTSANRDEDVFRDPFRFDVARDPNPHVSFGAGGPHVCMGAHLSRLEIKVVFEEILQQVKSPRLAGEPERLKSHRFRSLVKLPVEFA